MSGAAAAQSFYGRPDDGGGRVPGRGEHHSTPRRCARRPSLVQADVGAGDGDVDEVGVERRDERLRLGSPKRQLNSSSLGPRA